MKHYMRKCLKRSLLVIPALLLLVYGMVQLPIMKRQLTAFASAMLSTEQQQWQIEGLSGHIPFDMHLARVQASHHAEIWLELEQLHLKANPFAYLWGVISVEALEAKAIRLHYLPDADTEEREADTEPTQMLSEQLAALPAIEIGHIRIDEILLPADVTAGEQTVWQFTAQGGLSGNTQHWQARLHRLDGIHTLLTAEAHLSNPAHLSLTLQEDAGGTLSTLAGLEKMDAPLRADLQFRQNRYELTGTSSVTVGDTSLLQLTMHTSGDNTVVEASGTLPKGLTGEIALPAREWTLIATGDASSQMFALNALQWKLGGLRLYGSAFYDKQTETIEDAYLLLRAADISEWQDVTGLALQGNMALTAEATGSIEQADIRLELLSEQLTLDSTEIKDTDALLSLTTNLRQWMEAGWASVMFTSTSQSQLAERALSLQAEGRLEETPIATLSQATLSVDEQQLTFSGEYHLQEDALSFQAKGENLALDALTGGKMAGTLSLALETEGNMQNLPLTFTAEAAGLQDMPAPMSAWMGNAASLTADILLSDTAVTLNEATLHSGELRASATAALPLNAKAKAAEIALKVEHPRYVPLTLDAEVKQTAKWLYLRDILFQAGELQITGYAKTHQQQKALEAELAIQGDSLAGLLAWAGQQQASGSIQGSITATGQAASMNLALAKLNMPQAGFSIEQAGVQAEMANLSTLAGLNAQASLENADMGGIYFYDAAINANSIDGMTSGVDVTADITAGLAEDMLSFSTALNLSQKQDMLTVLLSKLTADKEGLVLSLANAPASFTLNQRTGAMQLSQTTLRLGEGDITLAADITPQKVTASVHSEAMPLQPLLAESGMVIPESFAMLDILASGKPSTPLVTTKMKVIAEELVDKDKPFSFTINSRWDNAAASPTLTAELYALLAQEQLMQGKVRLPASLSLSPIALQVAENKPLQGNLSLAMPLAHLGVFLEPLGHQLDGTLTGNMAFSGTAAKPAWDGALSLQQGSYDHVRAGICLREMDIALQADDRQIQFTQFEATGLNGKGKLLGNGSYRLDTQAIDAHISMEKLAAFCGGLAKGRIAGDVALTGDAAAMRAVGALRLTPLAITIPSSGAGDIPSIPYVYRSQLQQEQDTPSAPSSAPLELDIAIEMPQRVFVRGRGLDAELTGQMQIAGNAANPLIHGNLNTVRGTLDVVGSTLNISKGQLRFVNGSPSKPYIDMLASTQSQNTTINVNVEGVATDPEISFSSTPSLPEDELLALLIFGRPLAEITPLQAVQLAQAVASLTGKGGGIGLLGTLRDGLGIDTLTFGADEQGGASIGAGKYISDKVFVAVEQGTTPDSRRFTTEIELTPQLRATTATTTQGAPAVGVQWQKDY